MKTFIIHYTPLKERRKNIVNLLEELNLEGQFISKYDKEELIDLGINNEQKTHEWEKQISCIKDVLISNIIKKNNNSFKNKIYWFLIKNSKNFIKPPFLKFRKLSLAEVSLTYKHLYALKEISKGKEPTLVIEDDVILKSYTKEYIEKAYNICKNKFDYIDLGGGCDLPLFDEDIKYKHDKRFIDLKIPRSRTTAAYMINPYAASLLAANILPISIPLDWKYQYIFLKENIQVAWSSPPAFIHGSEKIFKSSLR